MRKKSELNTGNMIKFGGVIIAPRDVKCYLPSLKLTISEYAKRFKVKRIYNNK